MDSKEAKEAYEELNKVSIQKLEEKERVYKRQMEAIQDENNKIKVDYNHILEESCRVQSNNKDHANEIANLQRSVDLLTQKLASSMKQAESYAEQLEQAQKFIKPQIVSVTRRVSAVGKIW